MEEKQGVMRLLLEVIVQSVADARAAAEGGADRLEIVRSIEQGGLTPPLSLVREIAAVTALPLRVMVRENAGYDTSAPEVASMRRDAAALAYMSIDGIVTGFARNGELRLDAVVAVLEDARQVPVTLHRAFDSVRDPLGAIDALKQVAQIDSILASGGDGDARSRCERLRKLAGRAGSRLRIIVGGGVDDEMFEELVRSRCVGEIHVGRLARDGGVQDAPVSVERVRRLRRLADGGR